MTETKLTWHHPLCEGECFACLIERTVKKEYGEVGLRYLLKQINDAPVQQAEQEPVAWRVRGYSQFKTGNPAPWRYVDGADKPTVNKPDCCDFEPLYAAPVRTKDLTDDEIDAVYEEWGAIPYTAAIRAVIAADRRKNK